MPKLPARGIAIGTDPIKGRDVVILIDVHGRRIARLPGYDLAGNPGAKGIWISRGHTYYRLDVSHNRLVRVADHVARNRMYDEGPEPRLRPAPGSRITGEVHGHWRFAYRSGIATLAQWSGECEVPHAFWIEDGVRRLITGEERLRAYVPVSIALGWHEGRAFVLLPETGCGSIREPQGIYAFTSPGEGSLIYRSRGHASADMW